MASFGLLSISALCATFVLPLRRVHCKTTDVCFVPKSVVKSTQSASIGARVLSKCGRRLALKLKLPPKVLHKAAEAAFLTEAKSKNARVFEISAHVKDPQVVEINPEPSTKARLITCVVSARSTPKSSSVSPGKRTTVQPPPKMEFTAYQVSRHRGP